MAVSFEGGYLLLGSAVAIDPPITIAGWMKPSTFNTDVLFAVKATAARQGYSVAIGGSGDHYVRGNKYFSFLTETARSAGQYSLDVWQHFGVVHISTASMTAYLDGVAGTTNTANFWPTSGLLANSSVAAEIDHADPGQPGYEYSGCLGQLGVWDIDLTAEEMALLAAGAAPDTIQSNHLILYLVMATAATAGVAEVGSAFTLMQDELADTCGTDPPVIDPDPPAPEQPSGYKYFIERMDNRIWPTIEDAWCVDAALALPMPEPEAILTVSSATGQRSITEYSVINGGSGYTSPIAQVTDALGTGSGALCDVTVSSGIIISAVALTNGEDYGHPVVTVLDTTGVGAVIQPIVTNYVTVSTNTSSFTASDVGSIIRVGGGKLEMISVSTVATGIANVIMPITYTFPNDPNNTPVPAIAGQWSMTAPVTTFSGLDHLEGYGVVALADGGVVTGLTVDAGSVTLPVAASSVVVGLPFVAQLQTMYMDLGGGPTVQTRRKDVSQVVLRVDGSRAPEIGLNQPDAAAQPNQAEIEWGTQIPGSSQAITAMTQIQFRMPEVPAGQPVPLWSGDLPISNLFSQWDSKGQIAVQQRDPVPLGVTALVSWLRAGDSTGQ